MKNLAQLYLLAAFTVVPSLAADTSPPHSPLDATQPMSDPKPKFEGFNSGIVPTTPASRLVKRQGRCATSNSYICPNADKCCPVGYNCVGSGANVGCCPIGKVCDLSITYCPAGQTDCTDIIGVSGCCPTATHKCAISGGTAGCERLGSSGGSSGSGTSVCDPGTFMCASGGCCPNGTTCVPGAPLCRKPCEPGWTQCSFGGCCDPGYSCDASTQLCRKVGGLSISRSATMLATTSKAVTSSTTFDNLFTSISIRSTSIRPTPIRPTSTIADQEPTSPSKPENEKPSSSAVSAQTGPRSSTTFLSQPTITSASTGSGNALKPGGWLGGFGIVFFFVFFHL